MLTRNEIMSQCQSGFNMYDCIEITLEKKYTHNIQTQEKTGKSFSRSCYAVDVCGIVVTCAGL